VSADDYQVARERMVREHVFNRGIRDRHVLRAMLETPRHLFLGADIGPQA
jgi:protein-L-isoaspartate O-methyltransferase